MSQLSGSSQYVIYLYYIVDYLDILAAKNVICHLSFRLLFH